MHLWSLTAFQILQKVPHLSSLFQFSVHCCYIRIDSPNSPRAMRRSFESSSPTFSFCSLSSRFPSGAICSYPSLGLPLFCYQFCFPNCILTPHLFMCPVLYLSQSSHAAAFFHGQPVPHFLPPTHIEFMSVLCCLLRES